MLSSPLLLLVIGTTLLPRTDALDNLANAAPQMGKIDCQHFQDFSEEVGVGGGGWLGFEGGRQRPAFDGIAGLCAGMRYVTNNGTYRIQQLVRLEMHRSNE